MALCCSDVAHQRKMSLSRIRQSSVRCAERRKQQAH